MCVCVRMRVSRAVGQAAWRFRTLACQLAPTVQRACSVSPPRHARAPSLSLSPQLVSQEDIDVFSKMFERYSQGNAGKLRRHHVGHIAEAYRSRANFIAQRRETMSRASILLNSRLTSISQVRGRSSSQPDFMSTASKSSVPGISDVDSTSSTMIGEVVVRVSKLDEISESLDDEL